MDEDFGKVPMYKINPKEIADFSSKLELYCDDKQSGILDLADEEEKEPEIYEMAYYQSTDKKSQVTSEPSFISNASVRTADDLELHGFDRDQNEYDIPFPTLAKWGVLGRLFQSERESLL
eukprot:CAMPEP_0196997618 /NCGR_PEP_ID=MMETSP1380-20130617/3173_1 /TAXON_ID=5936 /ORGANISM="Euplotes crassus, Strain CT5" /LENGTH=119 /DNA_ID=CAMNT_0042413889 /DNA_START=233 /DNA_END=592 /DNA_ORIENTATION=-